MERDVKTPSATPDRIVVSAERARQGAKQNRVILVLAASLLLAAIALGALMIWTWRGAP